MKSPKNKTLKTYFER